MQERSKKEYLAARLSLVVRAMVVVTEEITSAIQSWRSGRTLAVNCKVASYGTVTPEEKVVTVTIQQATRQLSDSNIIK